jgi:hypothetical protein
MSVFCEDLMMMMNRRRRRRKKRKKRGIWEGYRAFA